MPKIIDLTGQHFGRLTVLNKTEKRCGHNIVWHCKCECGNECDINGGDLRQGKTKSCGCLKKEKTAEIGKKYGGKEVEDITNKKFGRLTPIQYDEELKKWKCKCDCGNYIYVRRSDLGSGNTKSCGCLRKETIAEFGREMKDDLTNKQFGRLTVIGDTGERQGAQPIWKCVCQCGSITYVTSANLKHGNVQSCGCLLSKGEEKISNILTENNIPFEKQKSFNTCIFEDTKRYAKFDFYVNNEYLIEFDGIQHFQSDKGWNTKEKYDALVKRDEFKNNWCKENNIPLIRIPYTQLNSLTLEQLKLDTSKFIKE